MLLFSPRTTNFQHFELVEAESEPSKTIVSSTLDSAKKRRRLESHSARICFFFRSERLDSGKASSNFCLYLILNSEPSATIRADRTQFGTRLTKTLKYRIELGPKVDARRTGYYMGQKAKISIAESN